MSEIERIKQFSNAFGVSGFEDEVVALAKAEMQDICDMHEDRMRNLHMKMRGNQGDVRIHFDAHSDEVGFMIQAIRPNGMMHFLPLGGWDPKNIVSNKVWIMNKTGGLVEGVVCSKPPHFMQESDKAAVLSFEDMYIDVGAVSDEEVLHAYGIGIGSPVVPAVECTYQEAHETFIGKAMDCRIGCAALLQTVKELKAMDVQHCISATLTSQEEVGERGMQCAISQIAADVVIAFEGCPADDTFHEPCMIQSGLKKGPMLRHFDRSMITHPRFQRYALDIAKKYHIPVQESVRKGGGTNGGITHVAQQGIPTIVIGIPVRYAHASFGIVAWEDYRNAIELAKEIAKNITLDHLQKF